MQLDHRIQTVASGLCVAAFVVASFAFFSGCARSEQSQQSLIVEEAKASHGLVALDENIGSLSRLVEAFEAADFPLPPVGSTSDISTEKGASGLLIVPGAGKALSLPAISEIELQELIQGVVLRAFSDLGYERSKENTVAETSDFGSTAASLQRDFDGKSRFVQLSVQRYRSKAPDIFINGGEFSGESGVANPDLAQLVTWFEESIAALSEAHQALQSEQLEYKIIQLSYVDSDGAVDALKGFAVNTLATLGEAVFPMAFESLPFVAKMPEPEEKHTGLVGGEGAGVKGAFDSSVVPSKATPLPSNANSTPDSRLIVGFHPAHPEQFSRVRQLLDEYIDRAARQIFIEGMVLEISEEGLNDLGIDWEFQKGNFQGNFGSPTAGGVQDTLTGVFDSTKNFQADWGARVRALVRDGKAEILSRPGVLTLNNRQATIRVGTDIPIATSQEGLSGGNKIAFNFKYLATGILLNVRPRVSEKGEKISMLVDIVVSDVVPGADLEQRDKDGLLLAKAPTVATRRVQTYARIDNRTPFIVGGLVSRENQTFRDQIPGLGNIPYLGKLFRSELTRSEKREVIIVLTPYVLAESRKLMPEPIQPKDEDLFDDFGNELFRDTYRLRSEDVFDLTFLLENRRLKEYQKLARAAINSNFRLAESLPFSEFEGGKIPGEAALVVRMIYDLVKRLSDDSVPVSRRADAKVSQSRLILLDGKRSGGFDVKFLDDLLAGLGGGDSVEDFFESNTGKAVAITFRYDRERLEAGRLSTEPVPEIALLKCPGRDEWGQLLLQLNQPAADGTKRFSILIHSEGDLLRLRRAILLRKIIELNGGMSRLNIQSFSVGKRLLIPEIKAHQTHVIDADTAQLFYHTEHYYKVAIDKLEASLNALDQRLREPDLRYLLEG